MAAGSVRRKLKPKLLDVCVLRVVDLGQDFELAHVELDDVRDGLSPLLRPRVSLLQVLDCVPQLDGFADADSHLLTDVGDVRRPVGQDSIHSEMVDRDDDGQDLSLGDEPSHAPLVAEICVLRVHLALGVNVNPVAFVDPVQAEIHALL